MQNILAEALVVWREPGYLEELLSFKIKIWTKLNLWSFGAINWSKVAWRKQLSRTHSTDGNQDTSSVPHDRRIGVKSYGDKLTILEQNQTKSADRSATSNAGPPALHARAAPTGGTTNTNLVRDCVVCPLLLPATGRENWRREGTPPCPFPLPMQRYTYTS